MTEALALRGARMSRRLLLLVVVGIVFAVLPASRADAHAFLWDSNPADGAVLTTPPSVLRLQFSESIVLSSTHIDVVDGDGRHYAPTNLRAVVQGDGTSKKEPVEVIASLPQLHRNTYRVSWETLSSDDLHRTAGIIVFGIEQQVQVAGFVEPTPRPDEATLRWLLLLCLSGSLGAVLIARLTRRHAGDLSGLVSARCKKIAVASALAGLVVAPALLLDQLWRSGWTFGLLLHSSYGGRWALRELGFALLLAGVLWRVHATRRQPIRSLLVAAGAAGVCVGTALLGHASAGAHFATTRIAADAAHLAAAATWAGAVAVAAVVLVPRLRRGGDDAAAARAGLRAFVWPAALCLSVMVVTGVYLASGVVGSVDAALRTFYGRTLLLKVGVAGLAALLGLINANRLRKHGHRDLRRTLIGEAVAVLTILALAAVLTSGQPAREPQLVRAPQVSTLPVVDGAVGDLQESLAVRPNVPGRNVVLIDVFNTRRPALAPIRQVDVMLVGLDGKPGEPLVAELISDGKWSVNADLPVSGHTRIIVNVHRPGLPDAEHSYAWTVGGAPAVVHTALVSNAPIGKLLTTVSAVLGVAAVAGWAGVLVWRRKQRLDAATGAGQSTEQDADPPMASSSV